MPRVFRNVCAMLALAGASTAFAVGPVSTAFTYQGLIQNNGLALSGPTDFQFSLFDAATGGTQIGSTFTAASVTPGQGGLINLPIDFGAGAFNGDARWLQIAVRSPAGSGSYTTLNGRQSLTATPYAMYAMNAGNSFWTANGSNISNTNTGFVGINRSTPVSGFDVFSVKSNAIAGYGGMYVQTNGASGQPFYGYSVNGGQDAYSFVDGFDARKWKLYVGNGSLTVNTSGQLGINNQSPTQALDVNGTARATDFAYAAPTTCYYSVSEADFKNRQPGESVGCGTGNGGAYPPANSAYGIIAPLHLPHGALITNVRIWYYDNDATANLSADILVHSNQGGYGNTPTVSSGGVSANARFMDLTSPNITIDNTGYDYSLEVVPSGLSGVWGNNMWVLNACVTYTVTKPTP